MLLHYTLLNGGFAVAEFITEAVIVYVQMLGCN